ncbi:MAG: ankyrin repeat domain-containing protein, partial [Verrucomicrobiales bacterium]|nr:ankyrin repeat domain-containing protein [Verrucomicrobiales bacterium]
FAAEPTPETSEDIFKRALFAEEGRRDFEAAIRDYERVVRGMDDQRRLAATALFRLGECYRKQRRTNDAVARFTRVIQEFPQEDTLVQISRQNLASLGASPPDQRPAPGSASTPQSPDSTAGSRGRPPVSDPQAATPAAMSPDLLAGQLETLRGWADDPVRQGKAVQALFPDATLDKLLTRLTEMKINAEALAKRPQDTWSESTTQMSPSISMAGTLESLVDFGEPIRSQLPPTRAQAGEIEKQLQFIATRVDHILGVQEARLELLKATTPDPNDGGELDRELALLQSQLQAVESKGPANRLPLLKSLFPEASQNLVALESRLDELLAQDARLAASLADNHPDRLGLRSVAERLRQQLDAAATDVLTGQRARLEALNDARDRLTKLHASATTPSPSRGNVPAATPSPGDEDSEIRRIQNLVEHSPDLINAGQEGTWPLYAAANRGQLAVARYLLDHGAKPALDASPMMPLHTAVANGHKAMTELLLERGAPVDGRTYFGATPLFFAAKAGFSGLTQVLLKHGANPNLPALRPASENDDVPSVGVPLNAAIAGNHLEVARLLLEKGADPNSRDEGPDAPADSGNPPLRFANTTEAMRLLLSKGANPNLTFRDGLYRLYYSAVAGKTEEVRTLLEGGALPDGPTNASDRCVSPLTAAIMSDKAPVVGLLLNRGASLNLTNGGYGPLHAALAKLDLEGVTRLLDRGADPNLALPGNLTPLQIALARDDSLQAARIPGLFSAQLPAFQPALPRGYGADPTGSGSGPGMDFQLSLSAAGIAPAPTPNEPYRLGPFVRRLLERGADPNRPFSDGAYLLHHLAARSMEGDGWEFLKKFKLDPNVRGPRDLTPLMVTVAHGPEEEFRWLIAAGADPNAQDAQGNTALHVVAHNGSEFFASRLLAAKASADLPNRFGTTPKDLALQPWQQLQVDAFSMPVPNEDSRPGGAFAEILARKARTPGHSALLKLFGVSTNAPTQGGSPP